MLDNVETLVAVIDKPWAKDASDQPVATWFSTDGATLVQHVEHRVSGVKYPVTADPKVSWSWHGVTYTLTRDETYYLAIGATAALGQKVGGWLAAGLAAARGYLAGGTSAPAQYVCRCV